MKRANLVWLVLALLVFLALSATVPLAQNPKPISYKGLVDSLNTHGITNSELAQIVTQRGVDFLLTAVTESYRPPKPPDPRPVTESPSPVVAQPVAVQATAVSLVPSKMVLDDGTPIKLRLNRNLSSADAKAGDSVDFEVLEEVNLGQLTVIPKGSLAIGTIVDAEAKKRMARGGKLDLRIDYVKLADGEKCTIRGVKQSNGGGHTGAMTGAMVATSLVAWPAAPFFLFMHGKDSTIPKGTEITAYVNGAMPIDPAKFGAGSSLSSKVASLFPDSAPPPASTASAQLEVTSNPAKAEILVDGNFVGSTPSELAVSSGFHTITISKHGYKTWERKLTVSSGKISIAADLEQ